MWSFGISKSSIALAIIAILLFAEMNAIASLKLQSPNNNWARRNSLTTDEKCCPDIGRRRTKRFLNLHLWTTLFGGASIYTGISALALGGAAGLIGAGLGLSAGLTAAGLGSSWKGKTGTSQTVPSSGIDFPYYGVPSPMGGIYCSNGGNNGHHHYYFYPPPCYYYYG